MNAHSETKQKNSASPHRPRLFVAHPPIDKDARPIIKKVLIANRGEIACRIIATCRKLSITSVAIYVTEDKASRHVKDADEAIHIGSIEDSTAGNPFLNIDLLVSTALSIGAQAIHPGYGYLSENAAFSEAVRNANLIFIGPSAQAMSTLGDKRSSKDYLREHEPSVPLIPGFTGSGNELNELQAAAEELGYPIMIKASAGGGGKGMRVVHDASKLQEELDRAQSEALRSFGSKDCILEKYIDAAKHVEIQILGDQHGNVVSLWERECSVQRRHQKVIEETPCIWLTSEKRQEMSDTAIKIGKLLAYEGAGTVEFVVDIKTGRFFFLEVNTRLQVEHPITEEVTGLDVVSLQFYVAAGGNLASLPAVVDIPQNGHAIECRLCAEDPQNDFFPQHGLVRMWAPVEHVEHIRYETAIQTGSSVSIHFDSLIAKIIVWAPTRSLAIEKMMRALANTVCLGIRTNLRFLQSCLAHEGIRDPEYTTSFIPFHLSALLEGPRLAGPFSQAAVMPIIPYIFLQWLRTQNHRPFRNVRHGFRNQKFDAVGIEALVIDCHDSDHNIGPLICISRGNITNAENEVQLLPLSEILQPKETSGAISPKSTSAASRVSAQYNALSTALRNNSCFSSTKRNNFKLDHCDPRIMEPIESRMLVSPWMAAKVQVTIDGYKFSAFIATEATGAAISSSHVGHRNRLFVHLPEVGTQVEYECFDVLTFFESLREKMESSAGDQDLLVRAPMPCKVLSVSKTKGEKVQAGETVMVIESMKMEVAMTAAVDGTVDILVSEGDAVDEGTVLCCVSTEE